MKSQALSRIRLGLIALALSGLLFALGIALRGEIDIADPGPLVILRALRATSDG